MTAPKLTRRNYGKGHSYYLDGEKIPGVTSVLGDGLAKPALINWAAKTVAGYAVERARRNQRFRLLELLHLEEDPVTPVPGLAIGNAPQPGRDPGGDLAQHRLGVSQVDTAVEMNVRGGHARAPWFQDPDRGRCAAGRHAGRI